MSMLPSWLGGTVRPKSVRGVDPIGNPKKSVYDFIGGLVSGSKSFVVDEASVLSITPAWRAIYILKDILATMPLNLYKLEADGDIVVAKDHPLNKLVAVSPHALYTAYEWMSAMIVNTLVCGNGLSRIIRNGSGIPTALLIVPYDCMDDILLSDDMQHLIYVVRINGKLTNLHSDDVVHFRGLTTNGMAGLNTTTLHKDTFASEMAMRDYVKSFLENGAFLSGVIEMPTTIAPDVYKRMKQSWEESYGGAKRSGKTPIMEGGAKYTPIQATIAQTGFEIVKSSSIADVSRVYGVPEYMIDAKNKPTYSSVEQMSIDFKKYTIDGWCVKIVQELTRKLVSKSGEGTYFYQYDSTGLTTGDLKTQGEYYQRLFNMSVLNPDEIRSFIKKNKVDHGERYFIQGNNMIPVDSIDAALANKGAKKAGADMNTIKEKP